MFMYKLIGQKPLLVPFVHGTPLMSSKIKMLLLLSKISRYGIERAKKREEAVAIVITFFLIDHFARWRTAASCWLEGAMVEGRVGQIRTRLTTH